MSEKIEFLYLNEQDMLDAGVRDIGRCMDSMCEMFKLVNRGDYRMGGDDANEHGIRLSFPKHTDIEGMPIHEPDKRFMAMPAYLGGRFHDVAIKCYGSNPHNMEKGLPRSILMVSLMETETGIPKAYMSANILSAMRTGATTGLGVRYFSKPSDRTIAIVGPGTMARYAMMAFMHDHPAFDSVRIKGRGQANIERFISFCKENFPQIKDYIVCDSVQEACEGADLVYFGTTNAAKFEDNPRIDRAWLKSGCVVISASALLVDTSFLAAKDVKLVSDIYAMYDGWGSGRPLPTQKNVSTLLGMGFFDAVSEGRIKREQITDIGEIISGAKSGRDSEDQIVLYAVGGLPIEDAAWAHDCYENAVKLGIGTKLTIWDAPQL